MKKIFLPLMLASSLFADQAMPKIKVIEGRILLQNSDEGKGIENKLKNVRTGLENEIKALEQKIQADITALTNKAKLLDADKLEREQERIMKLKKEHELKLNQANEDFQRSVNREIGKMQKKVEDAIKEIAVKKGWDIVIMKESGQVVYNSDPVDGTNDVLQLLNKNFTENKKVPAVAAK